MSWIAVAVGTASAIAGGVQANANRQRQKGIIGTAYQTAQQRMTIQQGDTREQVGEASGQRGLDQGGDVTLGQPVGPGAVPSVGGAHSLGAQQTLDEQREQVIEQNSLKNESQADLSNVNAAADQGIIGAVAGGVQTAVGVKGGLNTLAAMKTPASGPTAMGTLSGDQGASPYPNSFGGIDPVDPLGRGSWAQPAAAGSTGAAKGATTTGSFNVNG